MDKNNDYTLVELFNELMNDDSWEADPAVRASCVYTLCGWGVVFPLFPQLG